MISIIVTCHGEAKDLPIILGSIEQQREYGPGKHSRTGVEFLYAAGGLCEYPREVIVSWDGISPQLQKLDFSKPVVHGYSVGQILSNPKEGSPGHHTRGPAIERAFGDWIVLSNADNYFVSGWLSRVTQELEKQPKAGVIYWNLVSNLWKWSDYGGSQIKRGHIDLSSVLVRADIAKKVGFPFRGYDGDWDYVKACCELASKKGLKIVKIPEILGVHN